MTSVETALTIGDCGSWVVDTLTNELYGHVVAADMFGDAYVVPLNETLEQIEEVLDAESVALPTASEVSAFIQHEFVSNGTGTAVASQDRHSPDKISDGSIVSEKILAPIASDSKSPKTGLVLEGQPAARKRYHFADVVSAVMDKETTKRLRVDQNKLLRLQLASRLFARTQYYYKKHDQKYHQPNNLGIHHLLHGLDTSTESDQDGCADSPASVFESTNLRLPVAPAAAATPVKPSKIESNLNSVKEDFFAPFHDSISSADKNDGTLAHDIRPIPQAP